jgi:hypothetical protein
MKQRACNGLALLLAALSAEGCGGGNGGNGGNGGAPAPQPQIPVVQSPQPPDYDISGPWTGTDSDSLGAGVIDLFLTQDGGVVQGFGGVTEDHRRTGFVAAVLSGSTLYFNFNYGSNCVRMVSGTLAVGPSSMTGTFNGTTTCGDKVQSGQVSLDSGRLNLAGRWAGPAPSDLGSGTWTWDLSQLDNRLTGTATIQTSNLQEADALQGVFVYPTQNPIFSMSMVLSSPPCAGVVVTLMPLRDTIPLTATQISGLATLSSPCLGGASGDFVLTKQ